MLFGLLTFLIAITISSVAIYYSVAGLVAIFAAAAVPIIIMGTALEVGKLVAAVWLHRYWNRAAWWLKTYLSIAVVVLMIITSMGIFGFLSKAHVEQNLASDTVIQRIEIIEGKILAEEKYIERQNDVLERIQSKDKSGVDRFNQDIAIEQKKIDDAYARIEVLDADVEAFTSRNKGFGGTGRVKQGLELREKQGPEREALMLKIEQASNKIDEIREKNDKSLDKVDNQVAIAEKNIFDSTTRIDGFLLDLEPLKGQVMKLESEVGPIRYIAEFVYGEEADRNLLEEAVRWVIITIIFVFDPLAVLLLIASQYTFRWRYIDAGGKTTPPAPSKPPSTPSAPKGGLKLSAIAPKKEPRTTSKPIKLSDISNAKTIPNKKVEPKVEVKVEEVKYDPEPVKKITEDKEEEFKQREKEEVEALRRVSYEAKESDEKIQANKQEWKEQNPNDTIHRHKELYIKGFIDELPWENMPVKEEPPMPLEQWNAMIESAEKEVAKEEPKKKTSNYIMRAETGDKQVKVKDRVPAEESNQTSQN